MNDCHSTWGTGAKPPATKTFQKQLSVNFIKLYVNTIQTIHYLPGNRLDFHWYCIPRVVSNLCNSLLGLEIFHLVRRKTVWSLKKTATASVNS